MRKTKAAPKLPPLKDPSEIGDEELDTAYRAFCERAKSWPDAKRKAGHAKFRAAFDRRRANDTRLTCNRFRFWLACPEKVCRRNKSCSGSDVNACHDRFWPLVPEKLKLEFRGLILALNDGLSREDAVRKVEADWERMEALARETGQGPAAESIKQVGEPTQGADGAMPAAQLADAVEAAPPLPRPHGPRVRVL